MTRFAKKLSSSLLHFGDMLALGATRETDSATTRRLENTQPCLFEGVRLQCAFGSVTSELYEDPGGNPTLLILGLASELCHHPIGLNQPKSDPFSEPDV